MNIKKLNFIFVLILMIGVLYLASVSAQEEELIDICGGETPLIECGEGLNIFGEGFEISESGFFSFLSEGGKLIFNKGEENEIILEGNEGVEISPQGEINFIKEGGEIIINGNKFENVAPTGSFEDYNNEGYINLDSITGKIKECSFWVGEGGGNYFINGAEFEAPAGSQVRYNYLDKGELRLVGNNEVIKLGKITDSIKISGSNVDIGKGNLFQGGVLDFDGEGGIFVGEGNNALINGVDIDMSRNVLLGQKVGLFFDGKSHEGNYLSFKENRLIYSKGEDSFFPVLNFEKENSYINLEKGDHVSFWGDSFILEKRDSEELIPKVIVPEGSWFFSDNDGKRVYFSEEGKIKLEPTSFKPELLKTTSSPVEIVFEKGNNQKVFIDNFNRLAIVPKDAEEYFADFEGIDILFSSRVKYNYVDEEDLERSTGLDVFFRDDVSEGSKQLVLGRLRDYYEDLNDEAKKSLEKLYVGEDYCGIFGACSVGNAIMIKPIEDSIDLSTFRHEASHTRFYEIQGEWKKEISKNKEYVKLGKSQIKLIEDFHDGKISEEEFDQKIEPLIQKREEIAQSPFEKSWGEISGFGYKEDETEAADFLEEYYREESYESKYGYVRPYGFFSISEDIATFHEQLNNPEFFKPLLSEENEWHEIYQEKLNLLHEYKFISEEEYNKILETAGLK